MKALIYCRVSGPSDPRTASLESQEESARVCAARIGATVQTVYVERHTGAELHERPQLMAAMDALRKGEAQALICHSVDRLSRDPLHLGVILSAAEQFNWQVHFALDSIDPTTMEGQLVAVVRGIAAKIQRLSIIEATRRGQLKRLQAGKIGGQGPELYGYRRTLDGKRVIHEPEAAIVRQIFDWYGRERLGIRAICQRLQASGVATPSQSKGYTRAADTWGIRAIATILRNPAYVGREHANRQQVVTRINRNTGRKYKAKIFRPIEEAVPLGAITPAIISEEVWALAQQQLRLNRGETMRNTQRPHLLRGLIQCGHCRRRMHPHVSEAGKYQYYRCRDTTAAITKGCGASISTVKADAVVWNSVFFLLANPREKINKWLESQSANSINPLAELPALEQRLTKLERGRDRLITFLASTDDETLVEATQAKLRAIAEERTQLLRQVDALHAHQRAEAAPSAKADALQAKVEQLRHEAQDFAGKRRILDSLGVRVVFSRSGGLLVRIEEMEMIL